MTYDERIRDVTIEWISERGSRKDESRPFCLVVGFVAPHCPFVCPKKYFDRHFSNMTLPNILPGHLENLHPLHKKMRRDSRIENLTDMEIRRTRAAYYGLVEWFDNLMGSVLEALQRNGLMENTVIMYTSDHGDQIGEHGLWWKSTFYEGSIGVPLIVSWPKQIEGGRRILRNASLIDIGPTLTDLAGAPDIPYASGQSFKPLLFGDDSNWEDEVFAEYHYPPQRMLRQGQWKLNVYLGYVPQLFNLSEDPGEFHDRAHNPECKDIMKSMMDRVMKGWDPEAVKEEINRKNNERTLLGEWVKVVKPYDPFF